MIMPDDVAATYNDAFSRLLEIDEQLWSLRGAAITVAAAIKRNPDKIALDHKDYVVLADMAGRHGIDAASWPTGEDLKTMFREWNEAREALLAAWQAVPENRRQSLRSPDEAPGGRNDRNRQL
jgi:hypothetical protein